MIDKKTTDREIDFSNMLLAIGLAFICLLTLSILVVFDLENNAAALAISTVLIVITLLVVMKKHRKSIKSSIMDKSTSNRGNTPCHPQRPLRALPRPQGPPTGHRGRYPPRA